MERALGALSAEEFKELVERTIDRRLQVWLTQLMDALVDSQTTDKDSLEQFIGMWADFTPEEDREFKTILEERASYFAGREIELSGMERALGALSAEEFEELIERTIDRRLEVWLTQLMDALLGWQPEDSTRLAPEFAASLKRSLEQARSGEGVDLQAFREQIEP
jgi:AcrR family transcriptional regulator